ncbi:MAG: tetratricopeptide repeat protein [Saprospiraceae bacterium]|jgi:tetratricopeptide (TPR) repeat protein|nr:tetratricopeptide repeat protein [Saprospiraceae bacterium]MDP4819672.1 tetratricopeptide repeat protein [Saprospiraceae bacterium]MDP4998774.1 tetratricopeptide repeat protein [Saprospiraceae bacterium]
MTNRLQQLLDLLAGQPEDAFLFFAIAKEYEKLGQSDEALRWYQQLVGKDPGYTGTYFHLGKLQEKVGDEEAARQTFQSGIAICRKAGDFHALSELQGALMNLDLGAD